MNAPHFVLNDGKQGRKRATAQRVTGVTRGTMRLHE